MGWKARPGRLELRRKTRPAGSGPSSRGAHFRDRSRCAIAGRGPRNFSRPWLCMCAGMRNACRRGCPAQRSVRPVPGAVRFPRDFCELNRRVSDFESNYFSCVFSSTAFSLALSFSFLLRLSSRALATSSCMCCRVIWACTSSWDRCAPG